MSIDKWLDRTYHYSANNCGHFVVEVYRELAGVDLTGVCTAFVNGDSEQYKREATKYKKLKKPSNLCIALIQGLDSVPHVGVVIEGKILHLSRLGVRFQPLDDFADKKLSFYQ